MPLGLRKLAKVFSSMQNVRKTSRRRPVSSTWYVARITPPYSSAHYFPQSEATGVSKEGTEEFFFRAHGDKYAFKAKNTAERSSWLVALEKKIEVAKATKDQIQASEGYKKRIESYGKFASLMPS